ncbi:hypothetical protein PInf_017781 [Phytophthora infestans]|nr:hypothetical protein PInf_017781 [Phytophthora infestans]
MVYMAHMLACIRYSFGYNKHHTNHWLPSDEESHHPLHTQYLGSLFWSVGIMTGLFEGELPRHSSDAKVGIRKRWKLGSTSSFTFSPFIEFQKVNKHKRLSIFEFRYYTDAESNDREAAKRLCRSIANDIQVELLKTTFAQIPIFDGCSDLFIVAMTSLLEMIAVPAQTILFSAGDDGDAMYIVHSGVLAVIIKSVTVREIRKGACFGELSVFSSIKRTAAVLSTTYSILYKLSRFHCDRVLDGYPDCAALIAAHVESTLNHMHGTNNYVLNTIISPRGSEMSICHSWIMIPVQIVFPLWQQPSWLTQAMDTILNIGLLIDILLNFSLSFTVDSEKIMNPMRSATKYFEGPFLFDLLCAFPYEYFHMAHYGLMRLPRLLRIFHAKQHLSELEHFFPANNTRQLLLLGALLTMMFHIVACIHFTISYIEGFNPNEAEAWISSTKLCLRRLNSTHLENCDGKLANERVDLDQLRNISAMEYSRSLYYAVGVLASPGKSVEPISDVQLVAALILMLSGFLITAIVVDNVQKRFTASAFEQKEFFATRTRIQLFLRPFAYQSYRRSRYFKEYAQF